MKIEACLKDSGKDNFEVTVDDEIQQDMTAVELRTVVTEHGGSSEQADALIKACRSARGKWQPITVAGK